MHEDEDVSRLAQRCFAEVLKETARRCSGVAVEQDGLLLVAGKDPCPIFVNSALRTKRMEAGEVLKRIAAFNAEQGHYCETWVRDGADADLEKAAVEAGMREAVELIGMELDASPEVPALGAGIELRRVVEAQGVRNFADVASEAFQEDAAGLRELVRSIFSEPRSILAPDTAAFVVWERGKPVSTALTMVKEGVAWIGWVATRPESRGHGLGRLATAAATRAGFLLGGKFASLEATKMGAPVYVRLGYREILRYRTYWPREVPR